MIHHAAIVQSSKSASKRFFLEILGATVANEFLLDPLLASTVFGIDDRAVPVIHYHLGGSLIEVFIQDPPEAHRIAHVCLECSAHGPILEKCDRAGLRRIHLPREEMVDLLFVFDEDGNRFEFFERRDAGPATAEDDGTKPARETPP